MKPCIECGKSNATYWENNFCDDCARELFSSQIERIKEIVYAERPGHVKVFKIKEILEGGK